ncbi:hypothetical protein RRG08_049318 [Elysia crispata]|uniref:Uncharacterized protein n=1 Tax=Elysia crispata TaxID=231223 RepID=A0AAE1B2T7_9GAST|nr:hypothetical protein RRG08_049318 [Elysia crispata]
MDPPQINARIAELAENLNDALDEVVVVAALIDNEQLQASLGEASAFFESARSGLDGKDREEILADVQVIYAQGKQWLLDLLADFGFDATDPDFADLMAGLTKVFGESEQQFIQDTESLNADELREVVKEDLTDLELAVNTVSGYLDVVDVHMVASIVDGVQQQVQSLVPKTAGLSYDQIRARIQPIIQAIQSLMQLN